MPYATTPPSPAWSIRIARAAGVAIAVLGIGILAGWLWDIPTLKSVIPGLTVVPANTAVGFCLLGAALGLLASPWASVRKQRLGYAATVLAGLLMTVILAEHFLPSGWELDQAGWKYLAALLGVSSPGRPPYLVAVAFLCYATALLLVNIRRRAWLAELLAAIPLFTCLLALPWDTVFMLGGPRADGTRHSPIPTAALLILGLGLLSARTQRGWMTILASPLQGGRLSRWLLPVAVIAPVLLWWGWQLGVRAGWWGPGAAGLLYFLLNMIILSAVVLSYAAALNRQESRSTRAEKQFRMVIEQSLVGLYIIQKDRFIYVNPCMEEMLGYCAAELTSRPVFEFIAPEDRSLARENVRKRIEGKVRDVRYPLRMLHHDGHRVHVEVHGTIAEIDDFPTIIGVMLNVTETIAAEVELRRSEERYRNLFESNPHPMWVYDRRTLAFLAVNDAALGHYGYGREEFLAMTIKDIRPPDELPLLEEHLAQPAPPVPERKVWRHRKKDGTVIEVEVVADDFRFDGRDARLVLVNDVTERLRAAAIQARLTAILEATTDLVAISNVGGPAFYINAAGRKLLGLDPGETVRLADCRPPFWRQMILEEAVPAAIRNGVWSGETVLRTKTGQDILMSQVLIAHKAPSGAVEALSTIARDIRAQKRLEEQLRQSQKMDAFGQLAGGVAHDFNNLLTVINGYCELLITGLVDADQTLPLLSEIKKAGDKAAGLTRQLLAFSRQQVLQPVVLDLNTQVQDLDKMLRRLIGEDIDLATVLEPNLATIKADPGQVEQVMLNLVINARDAMPQGGMITIETGNVVLDEGYAALRTEVTPGPHVVVAVSDTGSGMSPEVKARIFEPFFTTKGVGKGTGLGLSTVHGIVKQSGGHIEVYSEPGVGTVFKVYFPAVVTATPCAPVEAAGPLLNGTETILLAEDEEGVRMMAVLTLQSHGYQVLAARDGQEALDYAEQYAGHIDLLVTDVVMPGRSGRQLAEALRERLPGMKVLYMSGYTDDAVVRHGLLHEEIAFLQKPYSPVALVRKVRQLLDETMGGT